MYGDLYTAKDRLQKKHTAKGIFGKRAGSQKKEEVAKKMVNGKKITSKMEHKAKKSGFYTHGDPRFGDVYEE